MDSKRLAYLGLESPSVLKKDPFVCPLRRPKKHQMGGTCQSFYRLCHTGATMEKKMATIRKRLKNLLIPI